MQSASSFRQGAGNKKKRTGKRGCPAGLSLSLVAAAALLLIMLPGSFHTVEAGEIAVVKRLGVIVKTETSGTYFDFWLTRSYEKYDAKVQQLEINTSAYTSDAQPMDISMTVQFQIRQDNVQDIAIDYGSLTALTNRIQSVAIERTKAELSQISGGSADRYPRKHFSVRGKHHLPGDRR